MKKLTKAGPLPAKDPTALIKDSGTCLQTPNVSKIVLTRFISESVAFWPGQKTVQPSPTIMGVLGMALITLADSKGAKH